MRLNPNRTRAPTPKTWAERHAPVATVIAAYSTLAAVLVAGFGYYFTVIPLYQKAAVDEQLAEREAELKQVEERLVLARKGSYELARSQLLERAALRASFKCGGIEHLSETLGAKERLSKAIGPCLASFTEQIVSTQRLSEVDTQTLKAATEKLGAELDEARVLAINQIEALPEKARADQTVLAPLGPSMRGSDEFLGRIERFLTPKQKADQQELRFSARVRNSQHRVALNFVTKSTSEITEFYRSGIWPRVRLTE